MTIWKRMRVLHLFAVLLYALMLATAATAQQYPNKPIRLISPWPPGGPADAIARPVITKLSQVLGQPVVLESKAGANGTIATAFVAKAAADGYTLLLSHPGPSAISPAIMRELPYDPIKDFEHITIFAAPAVVLVVRSDVPAKTVPEFISYVRANPGKIEYGSVGLGSNVHLGMELLAMSANLKLLHVPYKGAAPLVTDLLGGRVQTAFMGYISAVPHVRAGALRMLAVASLERASVAPELPTVAATVPGFEIGAWYGLSAPAGTPKGILAKLYAECAKILRDPEVIARLRETGSDSGGMPPEAFTAKIKSDIALWAKVAEAAHIEKQ